MRIVTDLDVTEALDHGRGMIIDHRERNHNDRGVPVHVRYTYRHIKITGLIELRSSVLILYLRYSRKVIQISYTCLSVRHLPGCVKELRNGACLRTGVIFYPQDNILFECRVVEHL